MAAGLVPEATEPRFRTEHVPDLLPRQQFDLRAEPGPLLDATLGDLDAARRMHWLDPAGLLLFGRNVVALRDIEQGRGTVAQHADEALARGTVSGNDVVRVRTRQCRDHLAIVASRSAPAWLHGLDDRDIDT